MEHISLGVGLDRFIRVSIPKSIEREIKLAEDSVLDQIRAQTEEQDDVQEDGVQTTNVDKKKKKKKKKSKSGTVLDEDGDDTVEEPDQTNVTPAVSSASSTSTLPSRPTTASSSSASSGLVSSTVASEPPVIEVSSAPNSTKSKKSKAKDVKAAANDEDDLDALLAEMKIDPNHCQHRGCGKPIKLVGMNCPYCHVRISSTPFRIFFFCGLRCLHDSEFYDHMVFLLNQIRFCFEHGMAEVHGCGADAKKAARDGLKAQVQCANPKHGIDYTGPGNEESIAFFPAGIIIESNIAQT